MKKIFFAGIMLVLLSFAFISKTNRTISGTIKDEKGSAIIGATIIVKGTKTGVASDVNGKFSIVIDDKIKALEVSAVGLETQKISLTHATNYTIILKANTSAFNDVVVTTALGVQRSPLITGYSTLQGKVAGVYIRGNKSIKYSSPGIAKDEKDENTEDDSWRYNGDFNTEGYDHIVENPFLKTNDNPLSTFSIDVDAASYANVRRFINEGELPPAGAVRIEELINYFSIIIIRNRKLMNRLV